MHTKRQFGFAAFGMASSFDLPGALKIIQHASSSGFSHVQFLVADDDRPEYYSGLSQAANHHGIKLSGLYATFAAGDKPACPVLYPREALAFAERCIRNAVLMLGEGGLLASPSLLRGLCAPDKGRVGPEDHALQLSFLQAVAPIARRHHIQLCVEPINRFETVGPNTVADTFELLHAADVLDVVKLMVDTCHSFLEQGTTTYADMWRRHADHIGLVHLSALNRGSFVDSSTFDAHVADVLKGPLRKVPLVFEIFGADSPEPFLSPLMIHQPERKPVFELAKLSRDWVVAQMSH